MEGKGESKRKETTTYETNKHWPISSYCHRTLNLCHLRSGSFPLIISKRNGISVFRGVSVICIGNQKHSGQIPVLLVNNYNKSCALQDKQSQIKKDNDPPLTSINLPFRLKKQTFTWSNNPLLPFSPPNTLTNNIHRINMSTLSHLFDLPEQICYVECGLCTTILLVMMIAVIIQYLHYHLLPFFFSFSFYLSV